MEEFDEDKAAALMAAASGLGQSDEVLNTAYEVLDLIYDYYDEHGELDISLDDGDGGDPLVADIAAYVSAQLARHPAAVELDSATVAAMVQAEIDYEDTLI